MHFLRAVWFTVLLALLINIPFGYWRAGSRKLSTAWFLAVHVPVILTIGMRLLLGIPFRFVTLPLYVLAFIGGQFMGGWILRNK